MGQVYALANQKGGVGKTTTAVNVAAFLAAAGRSVLLVDCDPQANATSSLGIDKMALARSMYDVLIGAESLASLTMLTRCKGLDLAPSSPVLSGAEVELVNLPDREYRLRQALQDIRTRYDFVLVDTPPSLGMLTLNALTAADGVIIPVQCEYLPLEGLTQLLRTIDLVQQSLNPNLEIRGVVLTLYDARTNLGREVIEEVRRYFPSVVFDSVIPRSVKLSEAPGYGEPISAYAPDSAGGQAYAALSSELLKRA